MAEQKESSVLFSLKELMNLEEDRIQQEEAEKQRQLQAQEQARMDAERRAREAEEARVRAEEERRRMEEQRAREEQARLEAMRQGEVERARLEAENAARMEAMRRQQDHERQLVAIKEGSGKKKIMGIAIAIGVLLFVGSIGGGVAYYKTVQEAEKQRILKEGELAEQKAQLDKLTAELKRQNEAVASLEGDVKNAKSEAERNAALARLDEAKQKQKQTQQAVGQVGRPAAAANPGKPKPACTGQAGDPLCSCL
jgi:colicin import membrane protein